MSTPNTPPDGGPAFPVDYDMSTFKHDHKGMSLRDYFAGQALETIRVGDFASCDDGANYCYDYADAMLKRRAQ